MERIAEQFLFLYLNAVFTGKHLQSIVKTHRLRLPPYLPYVSFRDRSLEIEAVYGPKIVWFLSSSKSNSRSMLVDTILVWSGSC